MESESSEQRVTERTSRKAHETPRLPMLYGIRAIAILMVFAEHSLGLQMGWAGVDLFFVLSGLLITGILRRERSSNHYWRNFYLKRSARILPPVVLFLIGFAVPFRPRLHFLWLTYIFFGANFATVFFSNLGGHIGILWSLAIEEHFYLL